MPKRTDIKKILIIGSGPIVIGQACEFDYSGTQACKALKEEGYEVVLVNSNPATIMTDPEMAHRTYIEPITPEVVEKIIAAERPDALLPTLGGQTGLNVAFEVARQGILERYGVEMIGASAEVIKKAEDREEFRAAMERIGLRIPRSGIARTMEEARAIARELGYPLIVRPSFTLGGTGGGVVYNREDLEEIAAAGLELSLIHEIMLEESVIGWKEYELEVMRDAKDNVVIICSIENLDPMGVHTGDSITVAPAQTLSDREYQMMRDAALAIMREIGVDTGGSNIQFAIHPQTGEMVVIEMNPRVSRSSALASKATGFPIAKIAAKLAIGYTLDEIPNDITRETMASFEPTIDYVVVKIPRFTFEKFPEAKDELTTSMKSVGETMAIGRTFKEALQKGLRGLEIGRAGLGADGKSPSDRGRSIPREELEARLRIPNSQRLFYIREALLAGFSPEEIHRLSLIDPWFIEQIRQIVAAEKDVKEKGHTSEGIYEAKRMGFSDQQIAFLTGKTASQVESLRKQWGIRPVYKLVDTCAAEFEAYTPYYYSTYEVENEARVSDRPSVMILGGGPNRIGQGIEFDYCCVHASFALREEGVESIMVNSNPETVSTDYDTSDKLYFEPLTFEDVMHIYEIHRPRGVIVQFGGQTPLNLAVPLARAGVPILGTSPDAIDRAEDRERFKALLEKLGLIQPPNGTAFTLEEAKDVASRIGYPVLVRPSYVLGGRAMQIVYDEEGLSRFMVEAAKVSPEHPVLIDKFLQDAIEVDVDALSDGTHTVIGGIMEHIEEAGIHSGDSACVLPPHTLKSSVVNEIAEATRALARELGVVGLMNVQYAVKGGELYVLEVNPRASRTVPFVSKATGVPLARLATKVMLGRSLKDLGFTSEIRVPHVAVKESVFPFRRFPGVDVLLGPEMKSTGEVMGIDQSFGLAFAKAQLAAGQRLPTEGTVFITVKDEDKEAIVETAKLLYDLGFKIIATEGTSVFLAKRGVPNQRVLKVSEGRPNVVDLIKNGQIQLVINTALGKRTKEDAYIIRRATLDYNIPYATTVAGAKAMALAVKAMKEEGFQVVPLQEYYRRVPECYYRRQGLIR
ncbi:carbamoyl-phosphate synthase large subunit [Thermosulfuriphilus ammonigenes]|uniref:Carbamoyl phosphate synthase large chain n=1 Tax=Thermosulfuriphilus ammonigenes TaxID=1936021 RepID=A0A6G7PUM3_9BACT|nr:carbamoyl-phosphate synthase large subunit [Thermosulfuriphilus ammonigenes]MBA2848571.1 carbamoyl-phosphate synthase large subunit [Thermosulfuriphilus ammonigenes]QIJ71287.1 carbamoyl-phosphate synthase large subunit [Thermosulfuriphilus ammonigenes]